MGLFDFWRKKPEPKKAERMTLADFAYADKQAAGTIMQASRQIAMTALIILISFLFIAYSSEILV